MSERKTKRKRFPWQGWRIRQMGRRKQEWKENTFTAKNFIVYSK